jgi:hypothetical protein
VAFILNRPLDLQSVHRKAHREVVVVKVAVNAHRIDHRSVRRKAHHEVVVVVVKVVAKSHRKAHRKVRPSGHRKAHRKVRPSGHRMVRLIIHQIIRRIVRQGISQGRSLILAIPLTDFIQVDPLSHPKVDTGDGRTLVAGIEAGTHFSSGTIRISERGEQI